MSFAHRGDVVGMKQGSNDKCVSLARRLPSLYARVNRQNAKLRYLCTSARRHLSQNLNAQKRVRTNF